MELKDVLNKYLKLDEMTPNQASLMRFGGVGKSKNWDNETSFSPKSNTLLRTSGRKNADTTLDKIAKDLARIVYVESGKLLSKTKSNNPNKMQYVYKKLIEYLNEVG